jgi:hypothetical protein
VDESAVLLTARSAGVADVPVGRDRERRIAGVLGRVPEIVVVLEQTGEMAVRDPWPGAVEPKTLIDAVLAQGATPVMQQVGFSGRRRVWRRRPSDGISQILGAEASPWNRVARDFVEDTSARFTFSLGIHVRGVDELLERSPVSGSLTLSSCHLSLRIGALLGGGDHWWGLSSLDQVDRVAREVTWALEDAAVPWFEELKTLVELQRSLDELPAGTIFPDARAAIAGLTSSGR